METQLRILVVEDEPDSRVLISRILAGAYDVKVSNSAPEAMEAFGDFDPHIVLTDIRMPGQYDGLVLLKKIKELSPDVLVIIVTGYGDKTTAIEAIRGGAFDFIEKPFRHEQLKYVIERAFR